MKQHTIPSILILLMMIFVFFPGISYSELLILDDRELSKVEAQAVTPNSSANSKQQRDENGVLIVSTDEDTLDLISNAKTCSQPLINPGYSTQFNGISHSSSINRAPSCCPGK